MSTNILLTGATGYLGGSILSQLLQHPDASSFEITAFLRSAEKAVKLDALGVKTIVGSFTDDRDSFVQAVSEADVVIAATNADDLPTASAVLEGNKLYHQKTGKKAALIHTSGTAIIMDDARGLTSEHLSYSDLDVEALTALPITALHRNVDIPIIEADKEGYVKAYLITPGTLFGYPTGPVYDTGIQNTHSMQVPYFIQVSIARKQGSYLGQGLNRWSAADVGEAAELYICVLDAIRADTDADANSAGLGHGAEGYYFAESCVYSGLDVAAAISEALNDHGLSATRDPGALSQDEAEQYFGAIWPLLATNCYAKGERSRALGWKPTKGHQEFVASVKAEVAAFLPNGN